MFEYLNIMKKTYITLTWTIKRDVSLQKGKIELHDIELSMTIIQPLFKQTEVLWGTAFTSFHHHTIKT